jgi:hypothetical protein
MRVTKSLPRASDASDAIPRYCTHLTMPPAGPTTMRPCATMTNCVALDAALPAMQLVRPGRGGGVRISNQLTGPKASGSEEAKTNHRGCRSGEGGWDCARQRVQGGRERTRERASETMWWIRDLEFPGRALGNVLAGGLALGGALLSRLVHIHQWRSQQLCLSCAYPGAFPSRRAFGRVCMCVCRCCVRRLRLPLSYAEQRRSQ